MKVSCGSPLQWLNALTKRMLDLENLELMVDGGFCRPGETDPLFPRGGIDLRWRWEADQGRIIIDFFKDGQILPWRWDELQPAKEMRFPSTVPDLIGIGHVGRLTFQYVLLSAAAEEHQMLEEAPAQLQDKTAENTGLVSVVLSPSPSDFTGLDMLPLLFLACPGFEGVHSALPHQPPDISCEEGAEIQQADVLSKLGSCLNSMLSNIHGTECQLAIAVIDAIASLLLSGTGSDASMQLGYLRLSLQPAHVVVCMGPPWKVHVVLYCFIAESQDQILDSDHAGKSAPFVLRMVSPELLAVDQGALKFSYSIQPARSACIKECIASDEEFLLSALVSQS